MVTPPLPVFRLRWNYFAEFAGPATEIRAATAADAAATYLASIKPPTHGTVYVEIVAGDGEPVVQRLSKVTRWEVTA